MKKLLTIMLLYLFSHQPCNGQADFYDENQQSKKNGISYLVSLPSGYDYNLNTVHPVIIFLHGGDGSNTKHHPKKYANNEGIDFPFIVIAPHAKGGTNWGALNFEEFLNEIEKKYKMDKERIYITGYSYGGYGTWSAITKYPELFAAAAPICGGGDPSKICMAKDLPIKAFHAKDDVVTPYSKSLEMINALKECSTKASLKTAISGGHGIWPSIYSNSEIYNWFLTNSR